MEDQSPIYNWQKKYFVWTGDPNKIPSGFKVVSEEEKAIILDYAKLLVDNNVDNDNND